ncbi:hypothetical protein [Roseimaritima ulvae]|uniref:Secreted protein n=1 Tax=Roseimaritima ulvae TaxID=980254 RepID=A0A5B9QN88_9BACT|nr:hypothetical protein [Roseimaritima ulvae]QEG40567.1 hypothetical protein UC8_25820 [Roseimaritima ulvae]
MSRCMLGILAALLLAGTATADPPVPTDPPNKLTPLMRMKLERSKAILEGLTLEQFDKIASNARALRLLSHESGWNVIQTEEYEAQSIDFRRSLKVIEKAAEDEDISRAALGYVSATVRCVECHRYMRSHRLPVLSLDAPVPVLKTPARVVTTSPDSE